VARACERTSPTPALALQWPQPSRWFSDSEAGRAEDNVDKDEVTLDELRQVKSGLMDDLLTGRVRVTG
jgi:hypothetical protein